MNILQFHASSFVKIHGLFCQLFTQIERDGDLNFADWQILVGAIKELKQECERLRLEFSLQLLDDFFADDFKRAQGAGDISRAVQELHRRVIDELRKPLFLYIPPDHKPYYEQKTPLFGETVEAKFPTLAEDISEAGKCLALNRYTAVVFHLMRVMEAGVQAFGTKLVGVSFGEKPIREYSWQEILNRVNPAIRAMNPKKDPLVQSYAEAAAHLYNVKVAWRNEVMHPKATYTEEEAKSIFENVKTFMADLAQLEGAR